MNNTKYTTIFFHRGYNDETQVTKNNNNNNNNNNNRTVIH